MRAADPLAESNPRKVLVRVLAFSIQEGKVRGMQQYPKPGATGGRLIRNMISFLKTNPIPVPIASHILIATSGGSDSLALAHLMTHYGRRVAQKDQITILHINHGWRGKESDSDAEFVKSRGRAWGVPVKVHKVRPPGENEEGESWEEIARVRRQRIYDRYAKKGALVFTAHQADDLAETLLWRLFTGQSATHGAGIQVRTDAEIRPFLRIRKAELQKYLKEEGESWREDATNHQGRFLRSRMRTELMKSLENLFPKAVEHLVDAALRVQQNQESLGSSGLGKTIGPDLLFGAAGLKPRRAHWKMLNQLLRSEPKAAELHLPGGWRLKRERLKKQRQTAPNACHERWILEKWEHPAVN